MFSMKTNSHSKRQIANNIWKLHLNTFLSEMMFFIPILVPFLKDFGFSMEQILVAESLYAMTLVILEVPSGYFADRMGRKKSIVTGAVLNVLGFYLYASFQTFWQFALANIVIGVGYAFISGADSALLYESLEQIKKLEIYKKVQGANFSWGRIASVTSTLLGGWLVTVEPRLPFYLTVPFFVLLLLNSLTLHETKVHHEIHEGWPHFKKIVKDSFYENKTLRNFLFFTGLTGFFTLGFFLNQEYMNFIQLPLVYFGAVIAAMNIASGLAAKYAAKIESIIGQKASLLVIPILPALSWILMGVFETLWIIPILIISSLLWGYSTPIFSEFLNKITTQDRRATVTSISNLLKRLFFSLFSPAIGYVSDVFTIQEALLLSAFILTLGGLISFASLKKVKII